MENMTEKSTKPTMNLYQKIAAIMSDVQYLTKDDHVSFGKTDYKALSEEKVTAVMHAEMIKYGLIVYPYQQVSSRDGIISHVDVMYRIVNVDNPDEHIEVASSGDGADTQDKGCGKAMTYAFKYMWLRTFALPTGEDPDKIASAEIDAAEEKDLICKGCGKRILGTVGTDGKSYSPADVYKMTHGYCAICAKKLKK